MFKINQYCFYNFDPQVLIKHPLVKEINRMDKRLRVRKKGNEYIVEIRYKSPSVFFRNNVLYLGKGKYLEVLRSKKLDRKIIYELHQLDSWKPYHGRLFENKIDNLNENLEEYHKRRLSDVHLDAFNVMLHSEFY